MEKYWSFVNIITVIIGQIVKGGIVGFFFRPFWKEGKRVVGIVSAYVLTMLSLYFMPYEVNAAIAYGIGIIVLYLSTIIIEKSSVFKNLFLSITVYLLVWIAGGIATLMWNGLYQIMILNSRVVEQPTLQFGLFILVEFIHVILEGGILTLMIFLFHRVYLRKKEDMSRQELMMLLTPYLSIITGYWIVSFMTDAYLTDTGVYIWNVHSWYDWMAAIFQIVSFLAILTMVMYYERIKISQEEKIQGMLLEEQVSELKKNISQVEDFYNGIRGMKHDLNNHIQILKELYENGAYHEANDYLLDMKKNYSEVQFDIKTGNPITDIIIIQKREEAESKGVSLKQNFFFPDHGNASAYDISIVLNNVLANAIEAASESNNKNVYIRSRIKRDIFFIEVRNSFDGKLVVDDESGLPETTKLKESGHGFGLLNVKKIVEKYYGGLVIEQDGNEIKISLMMVIPT